MKLDRVKEWLHELWDRRPELSGREGFPTKFFTLAAVAALALGAVVAAGVQFFLFRPGPTPVFPEANGFPLPAATSTTSSAPATSSAAPSGRAGGQGVAGTRAPWTDPDPAAAPGVVVVQQPSGGGPVSTPRPTSTSGPAVARPTTAPARPAPGGPTGTPAAPTTPAVPSTEPAPVTSTPVGDGGEPASEPKPCKTNPAGKVKCPKP